LIRFLLLLTLAVGLQAEVVQLEKKIFFTYKEATLTPEAKAYLDDLAPLLKRQKNLKNAVLEINGHTDGRGELGLKKLSEERACTVKNYLVKQHGIDAKRLRCIGHGATQPVADDNYREGRSLNRRVVIALPDENPKAAKLPAGSYASYRYDALGRLIAADYANGRKIRIEYDPDGNILSRTDSAR